MRFYKILRESCYELINQRLVSQALSLIKDIEFNSSYAEILA